LKWLLQNNYAADNEKIVSTKQDDTPLNYSWSAKTLPGLHNVS